VKYDPKKKSDFIRLLSELIRGKINLVEPKYGNVKFSEDPGPVFVNVPAISFSGSS